MRFSNYACIDSVLNDLGNISDLAQLSFNSTPVIYDGGGGGTSVVLPKVEDSNFHLSPNPSTNDIMIRSGNGHSIGSIAIFDATGRIEFLTTGIEDSEYSLNVRFLPNGTYYLSSGQHTAKFVIKR